MGKEGFCIALFILFFVYEVDFDVSKLVGLFIIDIYLILLEVFLYYTTTYLLNLSVCGSYLILTMLSINMRDF